MNVIPVRRTWLRPVNHLRYAFMALVSSMMATPPAAADTPKVTITGGADASGYKYIWTVSNEYTSPVVYVEFPHYHGSLFLAPENWRVECTFLVNVGVADRHGICKASADSPSAGIGRSKSGTFRMRVMLTGTTRVQGTVVVRFADGTELAVPAVELPQRETTGDKFVPLVGLAVLFIVLVAVRARRRGRR